MTEFIIEIAGVKVQIRALYEKTRDYCADYLSEGCADISVQISQADIDAERQYDARERAMEGKPQMDFSDAYLEPLAVYRKIVNQLVEHNILLFHGSVVSMDNRAYLFTAKSGTGKSTHTRLWRQEFGEKVIMVNDDKPLLKISPEGVLVCGTPWDGKHRLNTNCMVPLKAICVLERGAENQIRAISPKEALPMLMQQSHRPNDLGKYMELLDTMTGTLAFYRMQCNMDPQAAHVAYEGMNDQPY